MSHQYILIYNSYNKLSIINNLNKLDIKTISLLSKTIRELVHSITQRNLFLDPKPLLFHFVIP